MPAVHTQQACRGDSLACSTLGGRVSPEVSHVLQVHVHSLNPMDLHCLRRLFLGWPATTPPDHSGTTGWPATCCPGDTGGALAAVPSQPAHCAASDGPPAAASTTETYVWLLHNCRPIIPKAALWREQAVAALQSDELPRSGRGPPLVHAGLPPLHVCPAWGTVDPGPALVAVFPPRCFCARL